MPIGSPKLRLRLLALLVDARLWAGVTMVVTAALYLSTLQWGVNGLGHPYTIDVGEIQNALPRWGTIHYPGYPLYSLAGSAFVTALRLVGVEPAAGASLFSALWGVVAAFLLYCTAQELGAGPVQAALGAMVASLSTSVWVDASLAEIHTMSMALLLGTILFALRFGHRGEQRDLLGLVLTFSVGFMHQRTMVFLAPAVLLLDYSRWPEIRRGILPVLAMAAVGPLTYLYLPIRAWGGARWTFGAVGTWRGFLQIFLDTKVERVVALPQDVGGWLERARLLARLLHVDLWLPVLAVGLAGLWLVAGRRRWRTAAALTLAWLPAMPSLVIWEGAVTDALLAAKLPLVQLGGVGLALAAQSMAGRGNCAGLLAALSLAAVIAAEVGAHRPPVLAITRAPGPEAVIARAEQVAQPAGGPPTTFMMPWGHEYWALMYAQAYKGRLPGLTLVDHNADLATIARSERLLTFSETLYLFPLDWWDERLGRAYLSSPAPDIVAICPTAASLSGTPGAAPFDLGNGIAILSASVEPREDQWVVTAEWLALAQPDADYSVAVHALAQDPPEGAADILAQADRQHPVCGWYPTTRWQPGEVVPDAYLLSVPQGSRPVAVRLGMYRVLADGRFENSAWLTLPLPGASGTP